MDTAMAPRSTGTAQAIRIDPAWPWDWENRPAKDECVHAWEIVVIGRLFDPERAGGPVRHVPHTALRLRRRCRSLCAAAPPPR